MDTNYCKYGCGQEGLFANLGFYTRGTFRCAKSANSCPAMKQKNKLAQPYSDCIKKAKIVEKIHTTQERNYGKGFKKEIGALAKKSRLSKNPNTYLDAAKTIANTNIEKYGVRSVTELDLFKNKIKATCITRYGVSSQFEREEFKIAAREARREKYILQTVNLHAALKFDGSINDERVYRTLVRRFTRRSVSLHNLKKSDSSQELDHRYSVAAGYLNHVPPEVIGSPYNLEYISGAENNHKKTKCSIGLRQLMEHFSDWTIIELL